MDRNVVIATILIAGIMFLWLYVFSPPPPRLPVAEEAAPIDTAQVAAEEEELAVTPLSAPPVAVADSATGALLEGEERLISVDTDLYTAVFSTKGGTLVSFRLKQYKLFDQVTPVELIDSLGAGAISLEFQSPGGRNRDTRAFFFEPSTEEDGLAVTEEATELSFVARIGEGSIRLTYSFAPGTYEIGVRVQQTNAASYQTDDGYEIVWNGAIPFTEDIRNRSEEASKIGVYARSGGEVEGVTLRGDEVDAKTLRGDVSWIGVKSKYFAAVVMVDPAAREAEVFGERRGEMDAPDLELAFRASLLMEPSTGRPDEFLLYLGPLEYREISGYDGVYEMVDYGWDAFEWMTRPLATFVFIPAFSLLSSFIANFGLVIIIFGFVIKLVLFPLTKSSYKSMAQMRELQPMMAEIKEKYKDNPKKQQQATMKLYKESGTNPLGSCLPMVLQYPIIISLWQFLQQSIEIRQEGFLWANDLSAPDAILQLPFSIPFYGDYVAGFTVLMGLSMIVQMRIQSTPAAGTQAKIFMYVMPIFIFVIFNKLPSGLSLYYLCYNVVTAVQQKWINTTLEKKKALEEGARGASKRTVASAKTPKRKAAVRRSASGKNLRRKGGSTKAKKHRGR